MADYGLLLQAALDMRAGLPRYVGHMTPNSPRLISFFAPALLAGIALMLPFGPATAQEGCTGQVCGLDTNAEVKAKLAGLAGVPLEAFDRMPIFLSLMGAGLSISEAKRSEREYGVETVLEAEFKATGKPIGSIENRAQIMNALIGLDEDLLIKELDTDLTKWDGEDIEAFFKSAGDLVGDGEAAAARKDVAYEPFKSE